MSFKKYDFRLNYDPVNFHSLSSSHSRGYLNICNSTTHNCRDMYHSHTEIMHLFHTFFNASQQNEQAHYQGYPMAIPQCLVFVCNSNSSLTVSWYFYIIIRNLYLGSQEERKDGDWILVCQGPHQFTILDPHSKFRFTLISSLPSCIWSVVGLGQTKLVWINLILFQYCGQKPDPGLDKEFEGEKLRPDIVRLHGCPGIPGIQVVSHLLTLQ